MGRECGAAGERSGWTGGSGRTRCEGRMQPQAAEREGVAPGRSSLVGFPGRLPECGPKGAAEESTA